MLDHIDTALRDLVATAAPPGVGVRVGRPTATGENVLHLFLHRLVEDIAARAASWTDEVDDLGRVVGRAGPSRRYRCCYALIAGGDTDDTDVHAALGAILVALADRIRVPPEFLPAPLRSAAAVIDLDVAHPDLPTLSPEWWTALGVPPRAHLDIVLTATVAPAVATVPAPPEEVALGMGRGVPSPPPRATPPPPARRVRE